MGATYHGKKAGSFGTGCFSLYATKNVMSGEGGMITTNDDALAEKCRMLRNHGMKRRYYHDMLGFNFRMTDLCAAIGLAQIDRLEDFTAKRRANAAYLNAKIESVITPKVKEGYGHVWHQYTIRVDGGRDRDAAVKQLNDGGIGTGIFYPVPAHQQEYMREIVGEVQSAGGRAAGEGSHLAAGASAVEPGRSRSDRDGSQSVTSIRYVTGVSLIRVAVIGVGAMGRNHARVYSEMPDVELVGVADADTRLAESVSSVVRARPTPIFASCSTSRSLMR